MAEIIRRGGNATKSQSQVHEAMAMVSLLFFCGEWWVLLGSPQSASKSNSLRVASTKKKSESEMESESQKKKNRNYDHGPDNVVSR